MPLCLLKAWEGHVKSKTYKKSLSRYNLVQRIQASSNDSPRTAWRALEEDPNPGKQVAKASYGSEELKVIAWCAADTWVEKFASRRGASTSSTESTQTSKIKCEIDPVVQPLPIFFEIVFQT